MDQNQNPLLRMAEERRQQSTEKKPAALALVMFAISIALICSPLFPIGVIMLIMLIKNLMKDSKGENQTGSSIWQSVEKKVKAAVHSDSQTDDDIEQVRVEDDDAETSSDLEEEMFRREDYGTNIWMTEEKQLEQLNTLLQAGILSKEEYRERKARIRDYNRV